MMKSRTFFFFFYHHRFSSSSIDSSIILSLIRTSEFIPFCWHPSAVYSVLFLRHFAAANTIPKRRNAKNMSFQSDPKFYSFDMSALSVSANICGVKTIKMIFTNVVLPTWFNSLHILQAHRHVQITLLLLTSF